MGTPLVEAEEHTAFIWCENADEITRGLHWGRPPVASARGRRSHRPFARVWPKELLGVRAEDRLKVEVVLELRGTKLGPFILEV